MIKPDMQVAKAANSVMIRPDTIAMPLAKPRVHEELFDMDDRGHLLEVLSLFNR